LKKGLRTGAAVLLCAAMAGCATTRIANMDTCGAFECADDETRLWTRADEFRGIIERSGYIYDDPGVTAYVNEILHKLVKEYEEANDVKLRAFVVADPFFNAFGTANGDIFIHTGMLALARNEDQLALILGHEATHFLNRHILRQFRSVINKSAFFSALDVTLGSASVFIGGASGFGRLLGAACVQGSVSGYSRDLERESDWQAFDMMTRHGYSVDESRKFFDQLFEATKDDKVQVAYFYSSHPRIKERIENTKRWMDDHGVSPGDDALAADERYSRVMRTLILDNTELEVMANKLGVAREHAARYEAQYPGEARPQFLLGKISVLEDKDEEAVMFLKEALVRDPDYQDAHRELGMLHYKADRKTEARGHFERYIALAPDAQDASYIKGYLNE